MHLSRKSLTFATSALGLFLLCACLPVTEAQTQGRVVRLAELEIDPAQLDSYKAALKEEIEASIRVEPGVLTLYAVALKDNPAQIRLFETYASPVAYEAHLKSAHFTKYKAATQGMVRALRLFETEPILLGEKTK